MNKINKTIIIFSLTIACVNMTSISFVDAKYQDSKEQWQKEREFYKESRKQFLEEKQKLNKARNIKNKAEYEEKAKEHLIKIIDVLISKLDRVENWVNNRRALSDSEKNEIIAEINEDKQWLIAKKDKVKDAKGAEIREQARDVKNYWHNNRSDIKKIVGEVLANRADVAVEKINTVSEKLEEAIQKAQANGKDVENAKKLLNDMNKKAELAKADIESARSAFAQITSKGDADHFFQQGKDKLNSAHRYLKEAYLIAKNIIEELRN